MAQPAHGRCRLMLSVSWRTFMSQRSSEKTTMAKPKKPEKTTDPKLWDKPRKVTIFLMPTYRKPTN